MLKYYLYECISDPVQASDIHFCYNNKTYN